MAANVENMFYVRETPWHGLGTRVNEALNSKEALIAAGLNWNVVQEPIYTEIEELVEGYKANIRDRVSWKAVESNRLDEKRLKEEQPEIYEKYKKSVLSRRFSVKAA